MKVLYIGGFNLPDKNAAAQRVVANAKAFRELGWEVTLVGLDKSANSFSFEDFECHNLKYPTGIIEWLEYLTSIKNYFPFLEQIKPQVVIAYNHPAIALSKLCGYCKKRGIKVLSDCTEWYTPEGNIFQKIIKKWDTRERMTKVHLRLDGVISISRFLHDYYTGKGIKSLLLPPLVDIQSEKWNVTRDKKAFKADEMLLTYAGSPGHKDALNRLVTIFEGLPESIRLRFEIIGLNRDQFLRLYEYKKELSSRVHFHGRLPHEKTLSLLSSSDFQIFIREDNLTTKAGFPTKFVESISAGVPVLTNLTSNIGDYLTDGVNGYPLDVTSDELLRNSLLRVLTLPRDSIEGVKRSIDRETFDYRRYVSEIKHFIDHL